MLRITPSVSSAAAKSYYRDALSRGDYYHSSPRSKGLLTEQEIVGAWGGRAAEKMGLRGSVSREAFELLCDNLNPSTGERLTPRTKDDRRVGYDMTFSVPKSVSVMALVGLGDDNSNRGNVGNAPRENGNATGNDIHALPGNGNAPRNVDNAPRPPAGNAASVAGSASGNESHTGASSHRGGADHRSGDHRIVAAFREAVRETLVEMERAMKTRVRRGGADTTRVTGNMAWAEFVHSTSRPVDGVPDPHLHTHAFVFNATFDPRERRWKAGEFGDLKRDAPYYQAACDSRLAEKLVKLGYQIERRGNAPGEWEIAGVPESVVAKFSRRTKEIEDLAAELNITDPQRKAALGATSRSRKRKSMTMDELREGWQRRMDDSERDAVRQVRRDADERADRGVRGVKGEMMEFDRASDIEASLDYAVRHTLERQSVVEEKRLLAEALGHGVGRMSLAGVRRIFEHQQKSGTLLSAEIGGERLVTTPGVHREEQHMLRLARDGRGTFAPIRKGHEIIDQSLSLEQRQVVRHILESTDSVIIVRGKAGVGKTRTMREVARAIGAEERWMQAAAPTAMATHEVLRTDGFINAETAAKVLADPSIKDRLNGQILWVDEAGLVSMPELRNLVTLAHDRNARLILSGDTRQHHAVGRGDALRLLETESGITPAELRDIRRQQRADYRAAADLLSRGELVAGFDALDRMGAIREIPGDERYTRLAETYLDSAREGRSTIVVAPTHKEGRATTGAIRDLLKKEGLVEPKEHTLTRLHNRQLTEAQRGEPRAYAAGDVVQFHQNARGGFRIGDRATVVGTTEQMVTVRNGRTDELTLLPIGSPKAFQVFRPMDFNLAAGDRLRITYNGRDVTGRHRLDNGCIYGVKSVSDRGVITLDNGWRVPSQFGHVTHGYAVTSYAAQGRTVQHVIMAQSEASAAATNLQQFYVSVTLGTTGITIFTDDKTALLRDVARDNSRMSATELLKNSTRTAGVTPPVPAPGLAPGKENFIDMGLWIAKQNTERMRRDVNRYLAANSRARTHDEQQREAMQRSGRVTGRSERDRGRGRDRGRDRGERGRER